MPRINAHRSSSELCRRWRIFLLAFQLVEQGGRRKKRKRVSLKILAEMVSFFWRYLANKYCIILTVSEGFTKCLENVYSYFPKYSGKEIK